MEILGIALSTLYVAALLLLCLYGVNCYIMILLHRRHRSRTPGQAGAADRGLATAPGDVTTPDDALPVVTVQLPLYNERYVAARLIEAVARFDYPADRLEIQVLDDSTDETGEIVAGVVGRLRRAGHRIEQIRRARREGFKAGALRDAFPRAHGELLAVFDADFVPPPDFLRRVLPHFADQRVGMVQARWGHLNPDYSSLTRAQALGIDGHFGVEQTARSWSGLFLNFNGTAGIWRRQAIAEAGGWATDTLTEDLDLSYRAQLRGWRLVYLPELVCPAELPVTIGAFKSQQHRWAKGSIQTALKILPALLRARLPLWVKYQAMVHLTHYAVHPLMVLVALLSVPLLLMDRFFMDLTWLFSSAVLFSLATFGPSSLYVYSQRQLYPDWRRRLLNMPFLMCAGTGIAVSNTRAVLGALVGSRNEFVRTPKFGVVRRGERWQGKAYASGSAWLAVFEGALAGYCAVGLSLFIARSRFLITPFLVIYTAGFTYVALLTALHALAAARPHLVVPAFGRRRAA
ncbi:MAG: glycosyltransferase [Deltaproteobacteria bacterium]|nr:glycosyltransferase [Deltaproteobacteria bacterium]